jgi:hypothetical protein
MKPGEVRDDRGLAAAAFTYKGAAVRFGSGVVAVKARLNARNRCFEQRILDKNPLRWVH